MTDATRYAPVVDVLSEPALLLTPQGRIEHRNAAAASALPRCTVGACITAAVTGDDPDLAERLTAYLARCAASPSAVPGTLAFAGVPHRLEGATLRRAGADGGALLLLRLQPKGAPGDRFALLTRQVEQLGREVRERKRAEATLREVNEALREAKDAAEAANRSKSHFLASMSHEIRTPLTSVLGFSAILAREVSSPHRDFALLIERSGRRLLDTLDAVLTLAKLEADRFELSPQPVAFAEEVHGVARLFAERANAKGLTLHCTADPDAAATYIHADRGALFSVLQNLISNAVKFTPAGSVDVRVRCVAGPDGADHVAVDVRDTGIGIDTAFLPHLFDSFSQESGGHGRTHEGTGLGLTITARLVDLMGGELHVESTKGRGTTFTVAFPATAPAPAAPEEEAHVPARTFHALIVEDHEPARYLLGDLLEPHGEVTVAASAEEAIDAIERTSFDIALVDIHLGNGPDGMSVLEHLRRPDARRRTAVAAVTAYALPGDRDRFLALGFDAYLAKPFTADDLLSVVAGLLEMDTADG